MLLVGRGSTRAREIRGIDTLDELNSKVNPRLFLKPKVPRLSGSGGTSPHQDLKEFQPNVTSSGGGLSVHHAGQCGG